MVQIKPKQVRKTKPSRYLSIKRQKKDKSNVGADGKLVCRYCKGKIPPKRRTFCSDSCVHEWRIRSDNSYMREQVFLRDLGICKECGTDTRYTKIELENLQRQIRISNDDESVKKYDTYLERMRLTKKEAVKSVWHADHIKPVIFGGGEAGLENLQTLCVKCHKSKTFKMKRGKVK